MTPLSLRALGPARLSPIAFGSMRLHERNLEDGDWLRLLSESIELGVTAFHSSSEYESYPRFRGLCGELPVAARARIQHVVKLAEPHFGDLAFSASKLFEKIDAYLGDLRADRLEVVQWMWRGNLKDEPGRLQGFAEAREAVSAAFSELRRTGKVGAVVPFPYTTSFAQRLLEGDGFDGLTVYLNPLEREMVPWIERAASQGRGTIAIRPFAAGKALVDHSPAACIRHVLGCRGVVTAVATFSSREHLSDLVGAATV